MGAAFGTRRPPPSTRWRRTSASAPGNPFRRTSRSAAGVGAEAGDTGPSMHSGSRSGQRLRQRRCRWTRAPIPPWGRSTCLRFSSGVSPRLSRAALHASVTRRATYYGCGPQLVSVRPGETKAAGSDAKRGVRTDPSLPSGRLVRPYRNDAPLRRIAASTIRTGGRIPGRCVDDGCGTRVPSTGRIR